MNENMRGELIEEYDEHNHFFTGGFQSLK